MPRTTAATASGRPRQSQTHHFPAEIGDVFHRAAAGTAQPGSGRVAIVGLGL